MVIILILRCSFSKVTARLILYEKNYTPDYNYSVGNFCF